MTGEMIFVAIIIILMLIGLSFEVIRADFLIFLALVIFLLSGVISSEQALKGFSNEGMLTVLLLFIVAGAIQKHGIIEMIVYRLLGKAKDARKSMIKVTLPIGFASGFLNNTPIVVALTPIIRDWAVDNGLSPSKFLIPLSYMTILGGTITMIGTSTTLVVHGLLLGSGMDGFSFFTTTVVGVPITIAGIIYLSTVGYKLLPEHLGAKDQISQETKEFLAEAIIEDNFEYQKNTVTELGSSVLDGIYIIEIIRNNSRVYPVAGDTKILTGDHIIFSGSLNTIGKIQKFKGVTIKTGTELTLDDVKNKDSHLVEAVVSHNSSLLNKTLKQANFKARHDAGVIAIHRNNQRIKSRVGDIVLKTGDTLLLLADNAFIENNKYSSDFYVVNDVAPPENLNQDMRKGWIGLIALISMILTVTLGWLSMLEAMLLLVVLLIGFKFITPNEIKKFVQFDVILLIASAFAVGEAMTESGLAQYIASGLTTLATPLGILGVLVITYIVTNIFTEIITNSAAAVLMFPISLEIASVLGIDYMGLIVTVAIAASASFMTPIGYQTNLIVYGPGGYKFTDYVKVGAPLSILTMIIACSIIYTVWY
ncbi:Sodium-dependent dicarboxylate transporter SdcS [Jeotgalicoccus aerolatus]|uniref:Di/tricarboxylate transporter n=1 Tax=Jeotgalicoccus aerolatus TaxID=709510 RepID=A0ABS4HLQ3_9STAP|nr:SLC13 family permease [Jeotgalicoccus aerolatus]MBP1951332.1 di/tricarboxylate transporter [Jeotgalicoccus aerolatus]NMA82196.1 SLC13 family permease [Jeotgalicoccus aerolatus]CAD2077111.1 Sodium-dependent dicarboxylate transporter SdcS [Jeotgalicoccus aerolatus]GGD98315.1 sodium:sulfate symporter [Jeotgalicoccus aerolatus]HJG32843.1 anion permease [Jeotgalicoccus aerolatus]